MANELFDHAYQQLHQLLPNTVCFFIDNASTWIIGNDADTIHRLFAIPYTHAGTSFQITVLPTEQAMQLVPAIVEKGRRIYIADLRTVLFHATSEQPFSPLQSDGKKVENSEFSQPLMLNGIYRDAQRVESTAFPVLGEPIAEALVVVRWGAEDLRGN